jgi:Putative adhesin
VAVCGAIVGVAAITLIVWSLASSQQRRVVYAVQGMTTGVSLDLGDADVVVVGGGRTTSVAVQHVDRYGFGHAPVAQRSVAGGVFRVRSRCPRTILHGCSVTYRVVVPDNVPLAVHTDSGSVRFDGYRGSARITTGAGDIDIDGFCGFALQARADHGGDIDASTACPPPQLSLRTTTGAVHVHVPPARYRVDASTSGPRPRVRGVTTDAGAPFAIQALSGSGAVTVERGGP